MHFSSCLVLLATLVFAQDHGEEESEEMGPVAFMWPADREWGASVDNTAPCGSAAEVGERTPFPMLNGQIALVMQDDAWHVDVSISHSNAPQSNDDFELIKAPIPDLDPGHMCYPIPNPAADVGEGSNATIQIKYTADFETDLNETYYACADITYVPTAEFNIQVPCFNVSSGDFSLPEEDDSEGDDASSSATTSSVPTSTADSSETEPTASDSDSSSLSSGAIAGIVIGVVAGVGGIAAFFFFWGRAKQRQKRREQEESVRAVKWAEDGQSSASGSKQEDRDIPLRDL